MDPYLPSVLPFNELREPSLRSALGKTSIKFICPSPSHGNCYLNDYDSDVYGRREARIVQGFAISA